MTRISKLKFHQDFVEGTALSIDGKEFRLLSIFPYETLRGHTIQLAEWEGHCAKCGATFLTRPKAHELPGGRNCDLHKIHKGKRT